MDAACKSYHSHNDSSLLWISNKVHGTADTLDLAREHEVGQVCQGCIVSLITGQSAAP